MAKYQQRPRQGNVYVWCSVREVHRITAWSVVR